MNNDKNFNAKQFLEATELSPLESLEVRGGTDEKKKKVEVEVKKGTN